MAKPSTRADDERLLDAINYRRRGFTCPQIADVLGSDGSYWSTRTFEVMRADVKLSGEPEAKVRGAYW